MKEIHKILKNQYWDNLTDESKIHGVADSISFPMQEEDVVNIISHMNTKKINVTIQGARTGLSGGSVPQGGHVMNMSRMNKITGIKYCAEKDEFILSLQPGVLLQDLNTAIRRKEIVIFNAKKQIRNDIDQFRRAGRYFFPPDPTESLASIGGIVSCNAAGPCSYAYGSVRQYVSQIRVVLSDGTVLTIRRGRNKCKKRICHINIENKNISFELPKYSFSNPKNSAGYFSQDDMDIIDLFIGAEGTLGIITSIDLRIIHEPNEKFRCISFFHNNDDALNFADKMKHAKDEFGNISVVALEYIDNYSMRLVEQQRSKIQAAEIIPEIDTSFAAGIYFELHSGNTDNLDYATQIAVDMMEMCGGNAENTWVSSEERELDPLKVFRHAIPESANVLMDDYKHNNPGLTTICTDMAVQEKNIKKMMEMYKRDLNNKKIQYIMYGHIGDNHLHINMLPKDMKEYEIGLELYKRWAKKIAEWGGTLSAEHGIGKQKVDMLKYFIDDANLKKMKIIKEIFDKNNILNRGNIFEIS